MAPLAKALGHKVKMAHVPDAEVAIGLVQDELGPGDAILIKGSNSIGLAALVEALASSPSAEVSVSAAASGVDGLGTGNF